MNPSYINPIDFEETLRLAKPAKRQTKVVSLVRSQTDKKELHGTQGSLDEIINSIYLSPTTRKFIDEGTEVGKRSEAMMTVLCSLAAEGVDDDSIIGVFEKFPIGEKYREKGNNREKWLLPQLDKARKRVEKLSYQDVIEAINNLSVTNTLNADKCVELLHNAELNTIENNQIINDLVRRGLGTKAELKSLWKYRKVELERKVIQVRRSQELSEASQNKKLVCWDNLNYNSMFRLVEEGILKHPGQWPYLQYAGCRSYVTTSEPTRSHAIGSPEKIPPKVCQIKTFDYQTILLSAEQSIFFYKDTDRGPKQIEVPGKLPNLLLNHPESKAPVVTGLITHPIVTNTGHYINHEGYDPSTQLYLSLGGIKFPQLDTGGKTEANANCDTIIQNMFNDFDWEDEDLDQAIAIAIFLTTLLRKTIDLAPGFLVRANLQGSGKTTLLRIVYVVCTGHDMPVSTLSEDTNELRKSILAHLMESPCMIIFDNVPDGFEIRSAVLPEVLTSHIFKDRLLGASKQVSAPTNVVIALTGNNVTTNADLARRIIPLGLQPKATNPEKRFFSHPDIVGHSRAIRTEMTQKALSIVSMYIRAGSPLNQNDVMGSGFPIWDKMVRFPILWATGVDIWNAVDKARNESEDLLSRHETISALKSFFSKEVEFTATDILTLIQDPSTDAPTQRLRNAFLGMGKNTVKSAASTGHALKKLQGFTADDGILRKRSVSRVSKYHIELLT